MDYFAAFNISASGMAVEKVRLETVATNLANANTTKGTDGSYYKPLRVISGPVSGAFEQQMSTSGVSSSLPAGVQVLEVRPIDTGPRLVYEPNHPHADAKGMVAYPNINPVSEMVTLIEATRAYEANVRAMNAAKTMALRALEIGSNK